MSDPRLLLTAAPKHAFRFVHEEVTRWVDLDAMGVVNNSVFLTMLEQARYAYFRALGAMAGGQSGERFPFVLGQTALRFVRPGRAGERLQIRARVVRLGRASFGMDYRIDGDGDELVLVATAELVCVDAALLSCPIPQALRAAVVEFERFSA